MATVVYSSPVEGWGNPTWDSEKVKPLMEFDGNYYYAVDKDYGTASGGFEEIIPNDTKVTNKYLLNVAINTSPKINGDADKATAMGVSDGGNAAAIAADKVTYEAS